MGKVPFEILIIYKYRKCNQYRKLLRVVGTRYTRYNLNTFTITRDAVYNIVVFFFSPSPILLFAVENIMYSTVDSFPNKPARVHM